MEYVILALVALLVLYVVGLYNGLVRLRNQVKNAWSQIDVQLKRRHDLIPNLVEVVKDYMSYEQETLQKVMEARAAAMLTQMAISRRREFLADATAVEFTRNPLGLASALEKLDNHLEKAFLHTANRATQHLYIVNPLRGFGMRSKALFSTHPPIMSRVRLLRAMA